MPAGTYACLSQFLAVKVAEGAARSTLRDMNSAVHGVEDLGLFPPTVAPCIGGCLRVGNPQGCSPTSTPKRWDTSAGRHQPRRSVSPSRFWLSYSLFLRVSEAASISPRNLQVLLVASFVSTKVGGTTVVRRPLARWADHWACHLLSLVGSDDDVGQQFAN